jgi:hypothetical protein
MQDQATKETRRLYQSQDTREIVINHQKEEGQPLVIGESSGKSTQAILH